MLAGRWAGLRAGLGAGSLVGAPAMCADHAVHLPFAVTETPDANEFFGWGDGVVFLVIDEFMQADLDGAETGERIHFYATLDQYPRYFAADICL